MLTWRARHLLWQRRAPTTVARAFWWKGDGSDDPNAPASPLAGSGIPSGTELAREPSIGPLEGEEIVGAGGIAKVGDGEDAPRFPRVVALPTTRPLFPGFVHPMTLTDAATIEAVLKGKEDGTPYVGMFLQHGVENTEEGDADASQLLDSSMLHSVGTFAQVLPNVTETMQGTQVLLLAHRRLEISEFAMGGPPLEVNVNHLTADPYDRNSDVVRAYTNEIMSTLKDVIASNPMFREHLQFFMQRFSLQDPARLADVAASLTTQPAAALQEVLEARDIVTRLELALVLLKKEREFAKVQREISQQVEEKMSKNQRTYFLQEQLKSIKKELGVEKDDKDALLQEFRERIAKDDVVVPEHAQKVIEEEMQKLSFLEKNSSEFNVTRSYLDWLSVIPWGKVSVLLFTVTFHANRAHNLTRSP
jgi:Lon-like ATP-dependent protease